MYPVASSLPRKIFPGCKSPCTTSEGAVAGLNRYGGCASAHEQHRVSRSGAEYRLWNSYSCTTLFSNLSPQLQVMGGVCLGFQDDLADMFEVHMVHPLSLPGRED